MIEMRTVVNLIWSVLIITLATSTLFLGTPASAKDLMGRADDAQSAMLILRDDLPRSASAKKSEPATYDIRALVNDSMVRNFIGLAEYAWDFNAPETITGFGPMPAPDAGRQR
jgi:hypothetical protein